RTRAAPAVDRPPTRCAPRRRARRPCPRGPRRPAAAPRPGARARAAAAWPPPPSPPTTPVRSPARRRASRRVPPVPPPAAPAARRPRRARRPPLRRGGGRSAVCSAAGLPPRGRLLALVVGPGCGGAAVSGATACFATPLVPVVRGVVRPGLARLLALAIGRIGNAM